MLKVRRELRAQQEELRAQQERVTTQLSAIEKDIVQVQNRMSMIFTEVEEDESVWPSRYIRQQEADRK